ncbi:Nif3-like dinuclear metal center hexameric protein, partial [Natrinema soli]
MQLSSVAERLDAELGTADYADVDASANGLQIGPEEAEIERVAFAVDGV